MFSLEANPGGKNQRVPIKRPFHEHIAIWKELSTELHPTSLSRPPLYANGNASALTYKVLQLADLHLTGISTTACSDPPTGLAVANCTEALATAFIEQLLDVEQPDFVAFSGDNVHVYGPSEHQAAIDAATDAVEARGIPYGMVFGNHEEEGDFPREKIVRLLSEKSHSYTERGPTDVAGVGNYMLNVSAPVDGAWGKKDDDVFRMYFLDSGAEADTDKYPFVFSEYDWIRPSQIEYYQKLSVLGNVKSGEVLPGIMFFHIPLAEFGLTNGDCFGEQHEWVHNQGMNLRLLSTLSTMGEIKAIFVGHDHLNEYCCRVDDVQLCYGGGAGFGRAYGSADFTRRARVIEWSVDSNNRREIRSWKRHWDDMSVVHSEEVLYSETEVVVSSS